MHLTEVRLRKNEERRLRAGHCWLFSNEIDTRATPVRDLPPGSLVRIVSARGDGLAIAYLNPQSLIAARVLTRDTDAVIDEAFLAGRLEEALAVRSPVFAEPWYRLVFGESDGLPGIVIDRFGGHCVVQLNTAGAENLREPLLGALQAVLRPDSILLRCDSRARALEGLDSHVTQASGATPGRVEVREGPVTAYCSPAAGQKTGWFFDQRPNRALVASLARGRTVLDVFSYLGGFALACLHAGAEHALCIEQSPAALELLQANSHGAGFDGQLDTRAGDAFELLAGLQAEGRQFGLVIVDPPALIPRRKDQAAGEEAYRRLNRMALAAVAPGGFLFTASCSQHLASDRLVDVVRRAGLKSGRRVRVLARGGQGADHPVHPAMPETAYLKGLLCHVV